MVKESQITSLVSMNIRPLLYKFVITEDPLNEDVTAPFEYGSQLQTDYYVSLLKKNLPQLDTSYRIKLKIIQKNFPKFNEPSNMTEAWFYDAKVTASLNEKGSIFAIVLEAEAFTPEVNTKLQALESQGIYIPSSSLIIGGYDIKGKRVREERRISIVTSQQGTANFELTELQQNRKYYVYISCGNDLPHFKKDLLSDKNIQRRVFKTK